MCGICQSKKDLVKSNNPIMPSICLSCLNKRLDYQNLKQANIFCRTYNIPFDPERWIELAKEHKERIFLIYVEVVAMEEPESLYTGDKTGDLWEAANVKWAQIRKHEQLIADIKPIREGFVSQMRIKWGSKYTLEQFIGLENLYTNTIKSFGVTTPLTQDMIKKIAIISVEMEEALSSGDLKAASEYAKIHSSLVKAAGLDVMLDVGESDTISTVAELCDYLEDRGFKFNFYDKVDRDIVDRTIKDQQEWTSNFVRDSTGIKQTYDMIEDLYKMSAEKIAATNAADKVSIEDLVEQAKLAVSSEFDKELDDENEDLEDIDMDDEGYEL